MGAMILPETSRPTNLVTSGKARMVESDVFGVCEQLYELDPALFVVELEGDAHHKWCVMEHCADGWERLVFKADELDGRVVQKARRIMSVPLEQRIAEAEKVEAEHRRQLAETEFERLYESMGRPMLTQLEKDGFIDQRSVSYPKAGVAGPRTRRAQEKKRKLAIEV